MEAVSQFREQGATMSEIERMLVTIHPASITPRFKPLIEKGLIKTDDRTRKSVRSNRQQRIHWASRILQGRRAMKLKHYIEKRGISRRYFAKIAKLDNSTITFLIQGKRKPSQETLTKIFIATKGEVTADDFYHA